MCESGEKTGTAHGDTARQLHAPCDDRELTVRAYSTIGGFVGVGCYRT